MTNDYLLHKWIEGKLTPEEQRAFEQRPEYPSLVALYQRTENLRVPVVDRDVVLQNVLQSKTQAAPRTARVRRLPRRRWVVGIAAAVAMLVAAIWFFPAANDTNLLAQTGTAEMLAGDLPDGSTYLLNAGSTLRQTSDDWTTQRHLRLTGEGFFEVERGVEFLVETERGAVRVLGTAFNVRAYDETLSVACREGTVEVRNAAGTAVDTLTVGQAVRLLADGTTQTFLPSPTDWRDGAFRYDDVPLRVVIAEIERQFDVEVDLPAGFGERRVTTTFRNDDLDVALRGALLPFGLDFERRDAERITVFER